MEARSGSRRALSALRNQILSRFQVLTVLVVAEEIDNLPQRSQLSLLVLRGLGAQVGAPTGNCRDTLFDIPEPHARTDANAYPLPYTFKFVTSTLPSSLLPLLPTFAVLLSDSEVVAEASESATSPFVSPKIRFYPKGDLKPQHRCRKDKRPGKAVLGSHAQNVYDRPRTGRKDLTTRDGTRCGGNRSPPA